MSLFVLSWRNLKVSCASTAQAERSVWCSRRTPPRCHSPEPTTAGKPGAYAEERLNLLTFVRDVMHVSDVAISRNVSCIS
jgi:hypothetical protein